MVEERIKLKAQDTPANQELTYAALMIDMLALAFLGIIYMADKRKLSATSKALREFLPKYVQERVRARTAVVYRPTIKPPLSTMVCQGARAISIWYNFYLGLVLAITRKDDNQFKVHSLRRLGGISVEEVNSIIEAFVAMSSPDPKVPAVVLRESETKGQWNRYLPLFTYPYKKLKGISDVPAGASLGTRTQTITTSNKTTTGSKRIPLPIPPNINVIHTGKKNKPN
jgi:hypothetical protein